MEISLSRDRASWKKRDLEGSRSFGLEAKRRENWMTSVPSAPGDGASSSSRVLAHARSL